jgi:predicted amidophosphoribosyltransferase
MVPSSKDVIAQALARAQIDAWFAPGAVRTGEAVEGQLRQRQLSGDARRLREAASWIVGRKAAGHSMLLIDDVYTSGASMHSFAAALREAGASQVVGLALIRSIGGTVYQEYLETIPRVGPLMIVG